MFGMFSNMDVLNEVGIEKAPENYKEFLEDCQILKDAGKTSHRGRRKGRDGHGDFFHCKEP